MGSFNKLREGYSTGSCAAAAAKAAAVAAVRGERPASVSITTPENKIFNLPVIYFPDGSCGVIKDAGDDPDSTNGILIKASVQISNASGDIKFKGGEGIGVVTLPGLKVPVGEPAINPVPRKMIEKAVRDVAGDAGAVVTVSAPGGEEIAKRTFNPRLGVVGGISVLGTTGRVKPMNEQALLDSMTLEINTQARRNRSALAVAFAGTGEAALRRAYNIENDAVVQCGNYIGHVLDETARLGVKKLLIGGHPGKLLKVASGTFCTHNRAGGGAKEALCAQAAIAKAAPRVVQKIYECTTTEDAMRVVSENGLTFVWGVLARIAAKRCLERSFGDLEIAATFIDNGGNILGATDNARDIALEIRNEK